MPNRHTAREDVLDLPLVGRAVSSDRLLTFVPQARDISVAAILET